MPVYQCNFVEYLWNREWFHQHFYFTDVEKSESQTNTVSGTYGGLKFNPLLRAAPAQFAKNHVQSSFK